MGFFRECGRLARGGAEYPSISEHRRDAAGVLPAIGADKKGP